MADRQLKFLSILSVFMLVHFAASSFAQDSFYKGKYVRIIVGAREARAASITTIPMTMRRATAG